MFKLHDLASELRAYYKFVTKCYSEARKYCYLRLKLQL